MKNCHELNFGWDGYNAEPPNLVAFNNCVEFIKECNKDNFYPYREAPSVRGGIGLTFKTNTQDKVYVEFLNSGFIMLADMRKKEDSFVVKWKQSFLELKNAVYGFCCIDLFRKEHSFKDIMMNCVYFNRHSNYIQKEKNSNHHYEVWINPSQKEILKQKIIENNYFQNHSESDTIVIAGIEFKVIESD